MCLFGLLLLSHGALAWSSPGWGINYTYHNYEQMTQYLQEVATYFPGLAELKTIGQSVHQKELWVMKLAGIPASTAGTPNIKFVGNIHGNEPVGKELILHFIHHLVTNYQKDEEVKWLLDNTIIHFLPSMNPDGYAKAQEGDCRSQTGRGNGKDVDLNRSFPDFFENNTILPQLETEAVMKWGAQHRFLLSASFHGGALVANYPYENHPKADLYKLIMTLIAGGGHIFDVLQKIPPDVKDELAPKPYPSPDDDVFQHLARAYANAHTTMHLGQQCGDDAPAFPGGITNGAAWYSLSGGMQDYNYVWQGCMELTLELSCCKFPRSGQLSRLWNENKAAMLELVRQSQNGIRGLVMDAMSGDPINNATLRISGRNMNFTTSQAGEFWRLLIPGTYILEAESKGYELQSFPFTVSKPLNSSRPSATWLNVYLKPASFEYQPTAPQPVNGCHMKYLSCFSIIYLLLCFVNINLG